MYNNLNQSFSLPPSHLPIVASASLRLLYSFLYSEHISYIQVFGFLPLPHSLLLLQQLPSRTPTTTNVGEDAGKKEPSYTAGQNIS
jgi:hypothetical protein